MNITLIIGLPGSGKTHLAKELANISGAEILDDLDKNGIDPIHREAKELIVTDPKAIGTPDNLRKLLKEWFPNMESCHIIAFENDKEACWQNIILRDDGRIISLTYMNWLSKHYDDSLYDEKRPVWKPMSRRILRRVGTPADDY